MIVLSALSSAALRCVPHAAETLDIVGCVLSIVMADPEVREVTAEATALPAKSENVHENPTVPSWSASSTVTPQCGGLCLLRWHMSLMCQP